MRRSLTAVLSGLAVLFASAIPGKAAETVTLIYGPWNRSIDVADLKHLAETGEARGFLGTILKLGNQDPQQLQRFLNLSFPFSLVQASDLLYSSLGTGLLDRAGTIVAPRVSNQDGRQALRAAILLSLSKDGQISPVELLENYPTNMRVNVDSLLGLIAQVGDLEALIRSLGSGGSN
ncbi:alpha/beta hydrolase [Synechococcus elongatus]|uniref:DUF1400 domain-containing protein n=2 Tax=Synechococcus elongatus TaxID=32046 RepID=Q31JY0_SYNE7|nr:alpha/beta hydrolase [Synechococcus elongatus]ABB58639.1 conserved hypothetical protein [Synechococcus elongatus PCC 7942 = FACHB-805]AJD56908.1 hypothetical protein M744_03125 [Synechococcus elongatus UTEX 2973]MBD2587860.1 alpha/beta hydrolase [Synechococcus elongatus FACHB-242]MBD2688928.1 alpha/beta hydrolase [Synechococcus elongatus FACHB-1061]MBD2707432.1 alpha/beta hydrolase [Synechococcus elongatus PCC 7942 = FACHB-805]